MVNTFQLVLMVLLETSVKNLVYTHTTEGIVSCFAIARENFVTLQMDVSDNLQVLFLLSLTISFFFLHRVSATAHPMKFSISLGKVSIFFSIGHQSLSVLQTKHFYLMS